MKRTTNFNPMGDRYHFDFKQCHFKNGWAQLDTRQDASYYGNWVNPIKLELMSYCEGDITHTQCDSEAEFIAQLREALECHKEHGWEPKIDGMCSPEIIERLTQLGFAQWLH